MMIHISDVLSHNIKDAKEIAEKLNFPIVLDCGSLLGAYREGGPIKGDEDDVDFAVPYSVAEFKMKEILDQFESRGFELFRMRPTVMTFKRNRVKVDLLFYKWSEEWQKYYITLYHEKEPYGLQTRKESYDNLGEIKYCGVNLKCPANIEQHLSDRYGDWKTPILRPEFSFQNYIDKGVMKKI